MKKIKSSLKIYVDKVPSTGQYRVQTLKGNTVVDKKTFDMRKDAEAYKLRQKRKFV